MRGTDRRRPEVNSCNDITAASRASTIMFGYSQRRCGPDFSNCLTTVLHRDNRCRGCSVDRSISFLRDMTTSPPAIQKRQRADRSFVGPPIEEAVCAQTTNRVDFDATNGRHTGRTTHQGHYLRRALRGQANRHPPRVSESERVSFSQERPRARNWTQTAEPAQRFLNTAQLNTAISPQGIGATPRQLLIPGSTPCLLLPRRAGRRSPHRLGFHANAPRRSADTAVWRWQRGYSPR